MTKPDISLATSRQIGMAMYDVPRQCGQHRWKPGMMEIRHVTALWERLHPGLDAPRNLGCRDYRARHSSAPQRRKRVHLA